MSEKNYYGVTRTEEYLAHYGIKGMKWGVRKAIASGNSKRLSRQYAKAQKKLAKLEKRAASGKKYAARAAALTAGAAAAGGLAAGGVGAVGSAMRATGRFGRKTLTGLGNAMDSAGRVMAGRRGVVGKVGNAIGTAGRSVRRAGKGINLTGAAQAVEDWGRANSKIQSAAGKKMVNEGMALITKGGNKDWRSTKPGALMRTRGYEMVERGKKMKYTNNQLARAGAAAVGAGLLGAAGYNAYRAATTKRAAKKAAQFRSEMNKAFAGTQYGKKSGSRQGRRRKRS